MTISENKTEITDIKPKSSYNTPDPVITDLNMTIAQMKMSGMTKTQIANKLGLTLPDILYHLKRVDTLMELSRKGDIGDPVNSHRARLQENFKRIEDVYEHILMPGRHETPKRKAVDGWKTNHERLKLAQTTAIQLDKGLGVLVDRTEQKIESFEEKRLTVVNRLELAAQYGAEIPQAIQAEYVDITPDDTNKPQISAKQPANTDTPCPSRDNN